MKPTKSIPLKKDSSVDVDLWLQQLPLAQAPTLLLKNACQLSQLTEDHLTFWGSSCFIQGLQIAELLAELPLDQEAIAAAIAYTSVEYGDLKLEDVKEQLGSSVETLVQGIQKMGALTSFQAGQAHKQIDQLRRMLLAMVTDVRVVVVKLAERLCIMRAIKSQPNAILQQLSQETLQIYAPLANRLGIHLLKWELEDIAFHYLHPDLYKDIALKLQERRPEREKNINTVVNTLKEALLTMNIHATVYGRAKHIYSLYKKMQRKNIDFSKIYDAYAIRVLTNNIQDCYTALSIAHELWTPITKEFTDYIRAPKANGYQSIHTAVIGPHQKNVEIQFRTHQMHADAEKGVAAHWIYKEGKKVTQNYEEKVAWLRQLLAWQKEVSQENNMPTDVEKKILEDRVYVFTPQGQIIDLPIGATPLDFAYAVHTAIGHRCRGAKINSKIVPLTYSLKTGEKVEILTAREEKPSLDWLIPQRGYLKTSRARAKVLHWLKEHTTHLSTDPEKTLSLQKELLKPTSTKNTPKDSPEKNNIIVHGLSHVMTQLAKCCTPLSGTPIIGYITQNRGITIHRQDCKNTLARLQTHQHRMIEVSWKMH